MKRRNNSRSSDITSPPRTNPGLNFDMDVFSLACTLYNLWSGTWRVPYPHTYMFTEMHKQFGQASLIHVNDVAQCIPSVIHKLERWVDQMSRASRDAVISPDHTNTNKNVLDHTFTLSDDTIYVLHCGFGISLGKPLDSGVKLKVNSSTTFSIHHPDTPLPLNTQSTPEYRPLPTIGEGVYKRAYILTPQYILLVTEMESIPSTENEARIQQVYDASMNNCNETLSSVKIGAYNFSIHRRGVALGEILPNAANLSPTQFATLATRLIAATRTLWELGYCHMDIKPDNILLLPPKGTLLTADISAYDVTLIDFGLSCRMTSTFVSNAFKVTCCWKSPLGITIDAIQVCIKVAAEAQYQLVYSNDSNNANNAKLIQKWRKVEAAFSGTPGQICRELAGKLSKLVGCETLHFSPHQIDTFIGLYAQAQPGLNVNHIAHAIRSALCWEATYHAAPLLSGGEPKKRKMIK